MQVLLQGVKTKQPLFGRHPQSVGYYLSLTAGTLRTVVDIGMMVLGTGLLVLALATFAETFELAETRLEVSTGAGLGALLIQLVCAGCAFGVASEGGYGSSDSVMRIPDGEVGVGRALSAFIFGLALLVGATWLAPTVESLSVPLRMAHEILASVAQAGAFVVPFVGVPASMMVRRTQARRFERAALFAVWVLATVVIARFPYIA